MATAAYRGKLPKPDPSGAWRPYVGRDRNRKPTRFTVGNRRDTSEGEAQRRLDAVRDLFDQQCKKLGLSYWHGDVLETARQLAAGQPGTVRFEKGDGVRLGRHVGKWIEKNLDWPDPVQKYEDEQLARLVFATATSPADPEHYRQIIAALSEVVRKQVQDAVSEITGRMTEQYGPAVVGKLPPDPLEAEHRTFHEALRAYRDHIDKTGDRDERHKLRPHPRRCQDRAKWLGKAHADFPLFQLDVTRLDELVSYWRNRPETALGRRCSIDHSNHMTDELFRVLRWLDNQPDWKWEMPKGAKSIKRKPVTLEQDYIAKRVRRITATTYTPEQLAIIAQRLDRFGKMILGLAVNCGMGPAEFGRVEIDDVLLDQQHPEVKLLGFDWTANWIIFDRRKTGEYGEWLLWSPVAVLLRWGIERSRSLGAKRIAVKDNGAHWYADHAKNSTIYLGKWWQAQPSNTDPHCGVVTAIAKEVEGFPRLTVKTLRKVLPNAVRPDYGKEVADLAVAHSIGRSAMVDKYSDKPYRKLHEAIRALETKFTPFLEALGQSDSAQI
jgi:hypothetical protein